jgi:hypothetical protein
VFDFRYHVASLAAVFIALVTGIIVGVAISGSGFVESQERDLLNGEIRALRDASSAPASGRPSSRRHRTPRRPSSRSRTAP